VKIVIGCDHLGYSNKYNIIQNLLHKGHYVADVGIHDNYNILYPDIVINVAKGIISGKFERAILLSGTGNGMAIVANKINGLYASVCHDVQTIQESVIANNCNVLIIGSEFIDEINAENLIEYWLTLKYDPRGEYADIVSKIRKIEEEGVFNGK